MGQQLEIFPLDGREQRIRTELREILDAPQWDRRTEQRLPYFSPVSVGLPSALQVNLSAFARDLSASGIGLVHLMPLEPGEVVITLPLSSGRSVTLRTMIVWCRDYGDGWYASGGWFLDVFYADTETKADAVG